MYSNFHTAHNSRVSLYSTFFSCFYTGTIVVTMQGDSDDEVNKLRTAALLSKPALVSNSVKVTTINNCQALKYIWQSYQTKCTMTKLSMTKDLYLDLLLQISAVR